jgi:hypothetical protein
MQLRIRLKAPTKKKSLKGKLSLFVRATYFTGNHGSSWIISCINFCDITRKSPREFVPINLRYLQFSLPYVTGSVPYFLFTAARSRQAIR